MQDKKFLELTIQLAEEAYKLNSIPIGAVLVDSEGEIVSKAFCEMKITNDETAHAEILCIRQAKESVNPKHNPQKLTMYTSLEPCFACTYFITRTNIKKVVWALSDPLGGGMTELKDSPKLKKDIENIEQIAEPYAGIKIESKALLRSYFEKKGKVEMVKLFSL